MIAQPKLSIIIPVLNEATEIRVQLPRLQSHRRRGAELILVDGGSEDDSIALAADLVDLTISAAPGRARQMNAGAEQASGSLLLFLHIDTVLPDTDIQGCITSNNEDHKGAFWGRFDVRLNAPGVAFRVIEWMMNQRSRLTGIATGDQALFVSSTLFKRLGGFKDLPLMEDVDLSSRLKKHSHPVCVRQRVLTSARRWQQYGIVHTVMTMWWLRLAFFMGIDARQLQRWYYGSNHPAVSANTLSDEG